DSPEAEIDTYRRWFGQRRVDGVVVVDLRVDDPRIPALEELAQPALVIGGPGHHGCLLSVYVDDARATALLVEHLVEQGHRRLARVARTAEILHTAQRDQTSPALCAQPGVAGGLQEAGFGADGAARATAELLAAPTRRPALGF